MRTNILKEIVVHNDKSYSIIRSVPSYKFEFGGNGLNKDALQAYRDWVGADHVLQTPTHFIFCETVPDVEYEEE